MRRALAALLAVLISGVAAGQGAPPNDAPVAAQAVQAGQPAPADGVFMPTATAAHLAQACRGAQLENEELKKALAQPQPVVFEPHTSWIIAGSAAALVLGFAVGYVAFH